MKKSICTFLTTVLLASSFSCLSETRPQTGFIEGSRLENISILEFSNLVSNITKLTVIFSRRVRSSQRVKIYAPQKIEEKDVYEVFINALALHGYGAVKNGNILKIVTLRRVRSMPLPVKSSR